MAMSSWDSTDGSPRWYTALRTSTLSAGLRSAPSRSIDCATGTTKASVAKSQCAHSRDAAA